MRICRHVDPQRFLDHCQEWLLEAELKNSTMLAVLHLLIKSDHPFETPIYLATIENDAGIVGCAVRAPPDPLILSEMPVGAMPLLAADVEKTYQTLSAVIGMEREVEPFARLWGQWRDSEFTEKVYWRWYALERIVTPSKLPSGSLRLAHRSDLNLVRNWAEQFAREIGTTVDVVGYFERRIRTNTLYLWEDDTPRSIVAVSGVTPNSVRLSGVFTAPDCRRQGYATATVASVSRLMHKSGYQFCLLFTEIADPFANRLYRNIGYKPLFDKVSINLSEQYEV